MKQLNATLRRAFLAFAFSVSTYAGDIELLPNATVRIAKSSTNANRVAIDVSSNLVQWLPLTNAAATKGQVTFVNDPNQSDPMRFFRIADGDETFAVAGYVDGGPTIGGVAGVIVECTGGGSVTTDANGFFHFDQRFARTNLPISVYVGADGLLAASREITDVDRGSLCILSTPYKGVSSNSGVVPDPILHTNVNRTINFKVTGGTRAGMQFAGHFQYSSVSLTGDISANGTFNETDASIVNPYLMTLNLGTSPTNQMYLFPVQSSSNGGWGYFSGIPGTNGTLAGNGTMTWTNEYPPIVAPTNLNGLAFLLDEKRIQFTNNFYTTPRNGTSFTHFFIGNLSLNTWNLTLTTDSPTESVGSLQLNFTNATQGSYTLQWPSEQPISGNMRRTEYIEPTIEVGEGVPAPDVPPILHISTASGGIGPNVDYSISFSGGTRGVFMLVGLMGSGSYTYTPGGVQAHLRMDYTNYPGDFDDMTLSFKGAAGSQTPSVFSGTQRVGGIDYSFTGTFTY